MCPAGRIGAHMEGSTQPLDALAHPRNAKVTRSRWNLAKTNAVVSNLQLDAIRVEAQDETDVSGLGVLGDIGERFLRHTIDRLTQRAVEIVRALVDGGHDLKPG